MGGFFGIASKSDCVMKLFFGVDYHSHLGTRRGGMALYGEEGFQRVIHNIQNAPFRTKFDADLDNLKGNIGIGCISDNEAQPLLINSILGSYAISTVGRINNLEELRDECFKNGKVQFIEMNKGLINPTEMVAALINQKPTIVEGLKYAQEKIKGSMSILLLFPDRIYASRDKYGRTPIIVGKSKNGYCVTFESSAYQNLGFTYVKDLGPGEIVSITNKDLTVESVPNKCMKMCSFLWTYYGYPTATYEGRNVEVMRYKCGELLRKRDEVEADAVAGVPDSGVPHAIGYSNSAHIPYIRPFIKYTPTWPRSFTPSSQAQRNLIARMKLIAIPELIKDKRLILIDDSIVRGTTSRRLIQILRRAGAKEVHFRISSPPVKFPCHFGIDTPSKADLISSQYDVEQVRKEIGADTLAFISIEGMFEALKGICPSTYGYCEGCFTGKYPVSVPCDLHCKLEK